MFMSDEPFASDAEQKERRPILGIILILAVLCLLLGGFFAFRSTLQAPEEPTSTATNTPTSTSTSTSTPTNTPTDVPTPTATDTPSPTPPPVTEEGPTCEVTSE